MRVRALDGFWHRDGRVIRPGDVLEMADDDALAAIQSGRAVAINPHEATAASDRERNRVCALLLRSDRTHRRM